MASVRTTSDGAWGRTGPVPARRPGAPNDLRIASPTLTGSGKSSCCPDGSVEEELNATLAISVIADHFGVSTAEVTERTVFTRDLGADSLDLIELTMRLENEFGVLIDDDETERCADVGCALRILSEKLPAGR